MRRTPRQPRRAKRCVAGSRVSSTRLRVLERRQQVEADAAAGSPRAARLAAAHSTSSGAPPGGDRSRARAGVDKSSAAPLLAQLEAGRPGALAEAVRERTVADDRDACRRRRRARAARGRRGGRGRPRRSRSSRARSCGRAAGSDHARLDGAGAPARLAERELVERLGDLEADVDAHEVHQLERAHAEAAAEPADPVDLLVGGGALLKQPQPLRRERAAAAVDQEAGAVGRDDHVLAHRLAGARATASDRRRRLLRANDLKQLHQRRRVEEVHPDDVLRPRGRAGK